MEKVNLHFTKVWFIFFFLFQLSLQNITEDIYISVTYNLTNLIPHTAYTIAVSCKPTEAQGDMYWSDRSVLNFTTNIDSMCPIIFMPSHRKVGGILCYPCLSVCKNKLNVKT